ncbi:MAG TPA: CoA-binding protein, partial [Acidimicrobiia bacterium]|nr:CoA-binding protein [Acidimicrobiia bacterium]
MSDLDRLLDPATIAIVGLSAEPAKHGGRVLSNLRILGFEGQVWGVNPRLPEVDGIDVFATVA